MDHSQAMIGGCQSFSCPATTCSYWDRLSGPDSPGNQMIRLAVAMMAVAIAIETDIFAVEPTRGTVRAIGSMAALEASSAQYNGRAFGL
jgi:hypothetical protein